MINDNNYPLNIYKIDTKAKLDKRKIFIILGIVLSFICILFIGKYLVRIGNQYQVYKQYEAQLQALQQQEENKIKQEEKERNPRLTDVRKTKCKQNLSIRYEKSLFNL
ncbi:MAG: hypothetical protein HFJ37_01195 [Clostridia bacterium]|nr:hypothetical protein [Clostridia bacterium]